MKNMPIIRYKNKKQYFRIIIRTMMRSVFCSYKYLLSVTEDFINNVLKDGNKLNSITPSGRVALNCVFSLPDINTIILPEYTCNVVPMSTGGKQIQYYPVGADYQFNMQDIVRMISDKPDCCIVLSSYLNRALDINKSIQTIREANDKCTIVLDECQNMTSIMNLPLLDNNTYAIYSFNNKVTYGFLGGAIIQGKNNQMKAWEFSPASLKDNVHGLIVVLRSGIKDLIAAIRNCFTVPKDPDVSEGKGIYGTDYKHILKVSIAAASLIKDDLNWHVSCVKNNRKVMSQLKQAGQMDFVPGINESVMPFIPIQNSIEQLQGKVPLKGRYGGLSKDISKRNICLILHNSMKAEIIR